MKKQFSKNKHGGWGVFPLVEYVSSMHKALVPFPAPQEEEGEQEQQMINKYKKKCPESWATKEMQIQTTLRAHLT